MSPTRPSLVTSFRRISFTSGSPLFGGSRAPVSPFFLRAEYLNRLAADVEGWNASERGGAGLFLVAEGRGGLDGLDRGQRHAGTEGQRDERKRAEFEI